MFNESGRTRLLIFRLAVSALVAGAGVFVSPWFVSSGFASDGEITCTATCMNGTCVATGNSCTCTCHWWSREAVCRCNAETTPTTIP